MLDRRVFLTAALGSLAAACKSPAPVAVSASPAAAAPPSAPDAEVQLNALFDQLVDESLTRRPEIITSLGLDTGRYAWAKSKLSDESLARRRQDKIEDAERLRRLRAFDRDRLTGMALANYDTVEFQLDTFARRGAFEFGEGVSPYVVTQLRGAYRDTPDFLDRQHTIENAADVEAYLARLRQLAVNIDQETERVVHDAQLRIVPPDFVLDRTLQQLRALRAVPAAESILTTSLAKRAAKLGVPAAAATTAEQIVGTEIYPAIDRQIEALGKLRPGAVHDAGIRRLPQGLEMYQLALRQYTTTGMTADEIHRLGVEQTSELAAQMDTILRGQGLTQGSVGARVQALGSDPRHLFPNTDAGRQQILDYCNQLIAELRPRLGEYFGVLPKTAVEVRRVPVYTEAGSPGGYYQRPALDGSRPGAFYINLRDTAELARWTLPTLTYHEAAPGHHFQLALVTELPQLPLIRKLGFFSANTEGWALYAEQLCEEMGLYEKDPLGHLGRLQAAIFRSARCVVDTGIHTQGWSREKAIDYMVETTGDHRAAMTTEVERYCARPGQATSYKVGHTMWVKLREDARKRLGEKFDIREFHDTGLTAGPMPLAVLERVIGDWVTKEIAHG
jgi:uncharacterized protein (DUF885 family)